jgi:hypothetical protein
MQNPMIPPLENGDSEALRRNRLNRLEFERRYQFMLTQKKAELIDGVVYMAAALRYRSHSLPHHVGFHAIASRSRSVPQGYVYVPQPNLQIKAFSNLDKVLC